MKKKPSAEDLTAAAWCAMLSQSSITPEVVPPGWFTVRQLATQWGRSECTTGERVKRLFRAGQVEKKGFIIKLDQIVRRTPHYKLK